MKGLIFTLTLICIFIPSICFGAKYRELRNDKNELIGYTTNSGNTSLLTIDGNSDYEDVKRWLVAGGVADSDNTILTRVKQVKVDEYKREAIRRITLQVSAWNNYEIVALIASIWNMLGSPSPAQTTAKDIYVYVKNTAIPNVNSKQNVADVQAIDVVNDINWP